jgi:rhamnulokinase
MYIAVDLGAESGRVIAGDLKRLEIVHRFPSRSVRIRGRLYWDAPGIYSEILGGLREAFRRYSDKIRSIGIDTWGVDYGLLDSTGDLLGNPFHYRDDRNDGIMEEVRARLGDRRLYEATGIQFLPFNTVFQLREEVAHRSQRLAVAMDFLTIPDLLNYWLCGVKANEFSNASTTGLYDPVAGEWAWDLIDELDIPRGIFRNVVPSGTVLGELSPDIAAELGAPDGVSIVAPACHDTGSAVAAVPAAPGESNFAYLSSGTWSLLGIERRLPLINDESREANFTNEGGADGGIRFLKNIMGLWILQESRNEWGDSRGSLPDYGVIAAEAKSADPPETTIDVDDPRFLKPGRPDDPMCARIDGYLREHGVRPPGSMGGYARLILESLAQRYAETIRTVERLNRKRIGALYIIGGGSQNDVLNQLTADAASLPVFAGPVEATALGNILMQSLAAGEISGIEEGRSLIRKYHTIREFLPRSK